MVALPPPLPPPASAPPPPAALRPFAGRLCCIASSRLRALYASITWQRGLRVGDRDRSDAEVTIQSVVFILGYSTSFRDSLAEASLPGAGL